MKRRIFVCVVSFIILPFFGIGQEPTPEAEAFFQKAMRQINARHTAWIKKSAVEANDRNLDEIAINDMAKKYGNLAGLNGQDIEAIAFLVMMQAAKSAQEDLKAIMAEVKSINNEKKQIGDAQRYIDEAKQPVTRLILDSFKLIATRQISTTTQPVRTQTKNVKTVNTRVTNTEISEVKEQLKKKSDSMNEMSEMTSLRLQTMMDRRSKFISTLSNIMKKISDTQNTIIQNLK